MSLDYVDGMMHPFINSLFNLIFTVPIMQKSVPLVSQGASYYKYYVEERTDTGLYLLC